MDWNKIARDVLPSFIGGVSGLVGSRLMQDDQQDPDIVLDLTGITLGGLTGYGTGKYLLKSSDVSKVLDQNLSKISTNKPEGKPFGKEDSEIPFDVLQKGEQAMLSVINGKRDGWIGSNKMYIGQDWQGRKGSVLQNPFHLGKDGTRDEVVEKYRRYLWTEYNKPDSPIRKELESLAERTRKGEDIQLACYCSPEKCHGDVIKACVEWMVRQKKKDQTISPSSYLPDNDGKDHINVYSKGKTELGRFLSNFAKTPITTEDGDFNSIEGYWYWLGSKDDRLRNLYGYQAKKVGKSLPRIQQLPEEEFQLKIKKAISSKLQAYSRFLEEGSKLSIPLQHYYVFNGNKKDAGYQWILDHIQHEFDNYKNK